MAKVSAFSALRYDTQKAPLLKAVCPPYDVINAWQEKGYRKNSPYNVVRIILPEPKGKNIRYRKAKEELCRWIEKGILKEDSRPAIYVYMQEYKVGKKVFSRYGFLSLLELDSKSRKKVLPHENVFPKPLFDRATLMKTTRSHLSPLFIIYRDKGAAISKSILKKIRNMKPEADISFEGVRNKLWRVVEKGFIDTLSRQIENAKVFIADGHHRFEASLAVRDYFDSMRKKDIGGHDQTLVYLVSSKDKGLLILPTYRAVKVLPKGFDIEYIKRRVAGYFDLSQIPAKKVESCLQKFADKRECAFVIFFKNRYLLLTLKNKAIIKKIGPKNNSYHWKRLDVSILHNLLLSKLLGIKEKIGQERNILYYKDPKELIQSVRSDKESLGVFLNSTRMEEVEKIAEAGERMPHKSTYFFPKPLTGLVIHKF
ncbi:MAG: DUF1015 domain-containing protein [Candidatus Omnitrophica bacterium]|nr:DUF1015 domain-containing protein [Candidatus Omnitrophota bacterium]